ncbi:MAG: hypothetical protein U9Q82_13675 [Chloroflexota bacterium]|nr:hypothetical protein [Chloroflexota bacterium]
MNVQQMTLNQIRLIGLESLASDLGPVGMARFLQQFETGTGNYTRERVEWLRENDVKTLGEKIVRKRQEEATRFLALRASIR